MIYKRGRHWHMDVMVHGIRYREALDTTDKREALALEKKRVGEIQQGKGASKTGRDFARMPFTAAADKFLEERKPHVAERTYILERNLLSPLRKAFGENFSSASPFQASTDAASERSASLDSRTNSARSGRCSYVRSC